MRHVLQKPRSPHPGRGRRWISGGSILSLLALLSLSAHRLDEILHSTLVHLGAGKIQVRCSLTPGTSLATNFIRGIDLNRDGALSDLELLAFGATYASNLAVRLNNKTLPLVLVDAQADDFKLLSEGTGMVRLDFESGAVALIPGTNQLGIVNRPAATNSICLIHAALPRQTNITILKQSRDTNQFQNQIEFLWNGTVQ